MPAQAENSHNILGRDRVRTEGNHLIQQAQGVAERSLGFSCNEGKSFIFSFYLLLSKDSGHSSR